MKLLSLSLPAFAKQWHDKPGCEVFLQPCTWCPGPALKDVFIFPTYSHQVSLYLQLERSLQHISGWCPAFPIIYTFTKMHYAFINYKPCQIRVSV